MCTEMFKNSHGTIVCNSKKQEAMKIAINTVKVIH